MLTTSRLLTLGLMLGGVATASCNKEAPPKPAGVEGTTSPATSAPAAEPTPAPAPVPANTAPVQAAADEEVQAPDPKQTISGTIVVPAARKKDVAKGNTVFIIARRAGGPPGPGSMLAVQKQEVTTFPMKFTISGRDAMIPGIPFEGAVSIMVRIDKDGDAMTRKKGDVSGQANDIQVGAQDVVINLDTVQKEDHTLGGGTGMGARPQGMPPGHP